MMLAFYKVNNSKNFDRHSFDNMTPEEITAKLNELSDEELRCYDLRNHLTIGEMVEDYNDDEVIGTSNWWCCMVDNEPKSRDNQLRSLKSEIIIDILDYMNRYGMKEWQFSDEVSKRIDFPYYIGNNNASECWFQKLMVTDNGELMAIVDFRLAEKEVANQEFFYDIPAESLITLKDCLRNELREQRTQLIKNWITASGGSSIQLDNTFSVYGEKATDIHVDDNGDVIVEMTNQYNTLSDKFFDVCDLTDRDFEAFCKYLQSMDKVVEYNRLVSLFSTFIERFGKDVADYDKKVIESTRCQNIATLDLDCKDCSLYRIIQHEENVEFDFCDNDGNDIVKTNKDLSLAEIKIITDALNVRYMIEFFK